MTIIQGILIGLLAANAIAHIVSYRKLKEVEDPNAMVTPLDILKNEQELSLGNFAEELKKLSFIPCLSF